MKTTKLLLEEKELIFDAFRRWGYLEADIDPLGSFRPIPHPEKAISITPRLSP